MDYNEINDYQQYGALNTLPSKAGVSEDKLAKLVAKELTDNALDAGHTCKVDYLENGFYVEDDGSGIDGTDNDIASLFSMNRPLRTTKLWRLPTRGALGNGLRVVAGTVCATNGTLIVSTKGRKLRLIPQYENGNTHPENLGVCPRIGTRIEVTLPGLSMGGALEWAGKTIWISQGENYDGYTSPWWYCSDSFRQLVTTSRNLALENFISKFDIDFDDPEMGRKAKQLCFPVIGKKLQTFTMSDCDALLAGLRKLLPTAPKAKELLRYGSTLADGHDYIGCEGSGTFTIRRDKGHEAKIPYAVQVWGKKCRTEGRPSVQFFVNKTHTTAELHVSMIQSSKWGKDTFFCLQGCGIECFPVSKTNSPMDIVISIITPYMPITDEGKEPDLKYVAQGVS